MVLIEDGQTGKTAIVDVHNRVATQARTLTNSACESWAEQIGGAYMITTTARALGTGAALTLFIKNTSSDKNLVFQYIEQHYGGGGGGAAPIYFSFDRNPTQPTTGAITIVPVNTNFASNLTAQVTALQWDGTTGTGMSGGTAGTLVYESIGTSTHGHTFEEILCLPPQASIGFYCKAATGGGMANFVVHFTMTDIHQFD